MSSDLYALVAMAARYWFCGLMVLIAFRAWRITVVDNRRAALLRLWSSETGCIGEFVINPGKTKRQQCVQIPREGVLGSSRSADVRIPAKEVKRIHATLEQREGGLLVCPRGHNEALLNGEHKGPALFMRDGDTLTIGKTKLLLVMFDPEPAADDKEDFTDDALWQGYDEPQYRATTQPPVGRFYAVKSPDGRAPTRKTSATKKPAVKSNKRKPNDILEFEDELWPDE